MHESLESHWASGDSNDSDSEAFGWWKVPYLHTYFGCLSQAVAYLHRSSILIRRGDLKPTKIIIDQFGMPFFTNFGLTHHFDPKGSYSDRPSLEMYHDPETSHESQRDERSDIFSLGCMFLEMATVIVGQPPRFPETQLSATSTQIKHNFEFRYMDALDAIDGYIEHLISIATTTLAENPESSRQASINAINRVLPTIRQMMDKDFTKRPYARDLYPWFRHLYDVPGVPGPCGSCEQEVRKESSGGKRAAGSIFNLKGEATTESSDQRNRLKWPSGATRY